MTESTRPSDDELPERPVSLADGDDLAVFREANDQALV